MKKIFLSIFLLSLSFFMLVCFTTACSTTTKRAWERKDASVFDYEYFPSRTIPAASDAQEFEIALDPRAKDLFMAAFSINDIDSFIKKSKAQCYVIVKGNTIIFESYAPGYDEKSTVTSFSCAKSFDSAMIGSLISDGKIKSVDEPVTNYLPELKERDERFEKIKIRHLMEMSSGIQYSENIFIADDTKTYFDPNLRYLALNKTKIKEEPGIHFCYNNYNPLLLGLIIERASGMSVAEYLSESIWKKMGSVYDASWSLDSDKDAYEKMESGINACPRDFAKFGCLYRDYGMAGGKQVLSREWIEESLSEKKHPEGYYSKDYWGTQICRGITDKNGTFSGGHYGYFWYSMHRQNAKDDFFAFGNKGQIIYVNRNTDVVICRFGFEYGMDTWKYLNAFYVLSQKL